MRWFPHASKAGEAAPPETTHPTSSAIRAGPAMESDIESRLLSYEDPVSLLEVREPSVIAAGTKRKDRRR